MKKRIGCLILAFLFFMFNVISPAYAAGISAQEGSAYTAEEQNTSQEEWSNDENNQTIKESGETALGFTEENLSKDESDLTNSENQMNTDSEEQVNDDSQNQMNTDSEEQVNDDSQNQANTDSEDQQEQNSEDSSESNLESNQQQENQNNEENSNQSSLGSNQISAVSGENSDDAEQDTPAIVEHAGQVDVSISPAMVLKKDINFEVSLSGATATDPKTVSLGTENSQVQKVSFCDLEVGAYELRVTAPGFKTYSQTIDVNQNGYSVRLMTGFVEGYDYEAGSAHPGALLIGDVDGDGDINETDKDLLIDTIASGKGSNDVIDLNSDGSVDLADVEYFVKGYRPKGETTATLEGFVPKSVIKPTVAEGTTIHEGSLEELLNNNTSITLKPSNEAPISEQNPVELAFDFSNMVDAGGEAEHQIPTTDAIIIGAGAEDAQVSNATIMVTYIDENGDEQQVEATVTDTSTFSRRSKSLVRSTVTATINADGTIHVNLGRQVAVKKVTIKIVGTKNNTNLAEISSVEFVNGMESRIPEVQMDIPENLQAIAGNKIINLSWRACVNITGYEVQISAGNTTETIQVTGNALSITSFGGKELKNLVTYTIKVQSINGTWSSGYCDAVEATPKPTSRPDKPDNVKATGKYRSIAVSWKDMKDTESYNVYYKQRNSEEEYTKVTGITKNSYTITGLSDLIEYEIYATGVNEFGESPESLHCLATTTDMNLAVVPKYGLINYTAESGEVSEHIVSAVQNGGTMKDSPLDTAAKTAWGTVDDEQTSYYYKGSWDDGGYNTLGNNGVIYTFDQPYKMDTIRFRHYTGGADYLKVRWWDESGKDRGEIRASMTNRQDSAGRSYREITLAEPIVAKKIQIGLAITPAYGNSISIADIYFYHYDTLMEELMTSLYEDDLHTILKDTTTQETIDALRERVNTVDEISGEYHPNREALLKELETAEKILKDGALKNAKSVPVHTDINTKDVGRGFSGLTAWQPLGVTVAAGEQITIYVGSDTQKTGTRTNIRLYLSQYHSESGGKSLGHYSQLKVGANTFTMPRSSLAEQEGGGALYVEYDGQTTNTRYAVRISGGVQVPRLDLYKVTENEERLTKTIAYVEELETYVANMESLHEEIHKGSSNTNVNQYDYDERNCILGAADILLDTMMFSIPAQQILRGAGSGSTEEKAQNILDSMNATEDMMHLFYQHKGLNNNARETINKIPSRHLNIRYQRMFSGAFMYAAGDHIGIEYPQTTNMVSAKPVVSEDGKYVSGNYFGWGSTHEIGHCINQGTYAVAEVTNNYFAQLARAKDTNQGMRFNYRNIYDKVTSGTKGSASNGATQLGMYWQLHLAYDKGYNYKTYDNYDEQLANLFYARVDTYARTPAKAPKPGNVALTLDGGTDQNLMRLACAAAEKDILEFFERWGKEPDEKTKAYAAQFEKETRAICYVSDDSRVYSMNGESALSGDGTTEAIANVTYEVNKNIANQVDFTFSSTNIPEDDILGYEITRCMISNGQVQKQVVGFTTNNTFSDTITTINNRAVYYEIRLVDQYLNYSAVKTLGQLKIEHDGSLDKTNWTISANNLTAEEATIDPDDDSLSCEVTKENAALLAIDHDINTEYIATVGSDNAEIEMAFNKTEVITGFKYTAGSKGAALGDYEILVQSDGTWTTAAEGTFSGEAINTVYFANADGKYISTYEADAVKLIIKGKNGSEVAIAELDVLGVTGDNVDFRRADDSDNTTVIGKLKNDYKYGDKDGDVIPKDSIIFMGSYKGNPAYNVVLLFDQDGNVVGGFDEEGALNAQQVILADVPDEGNIADTSDGTWIYWIEPEQNIDLSSITSVRTELYRVNNALTNEGQRLVSDSLFENMPQLDSLPEIELSGQGVQAEKK